MNIIHLFVFFKPIKNTYIHLPFFKVVSCKCLILNENISKQSSGRRIFSLWDIYMYVLDIYKKKYLSTAVAIRIRNIKLLTIWEKSSVITQNKHGKRLINWPKLLDRMGEFKTYFIRLKIEILALASGRVPILFTVIPSYCLFIWIKIFHKCMYRTTLNKHLGSVVELVIKLIRWSALITYLIPNPILS